MIDDDTKQKTQELATQLRQSLVPIDDDDSPIDTLRNQMKILHQITNRMLADADKRSDKLIQYNLALKAQNQYRKTLLTVEDLNARGRS